MEKEEFEKELNRLSAESWKKEKEFREKYLLSNCQIKIGDIVKDGIYIIKVDKIIYNHGVSVSELIFEGYMLNKNKTPKKYPKRASLYGERVTKY